MLKFSKIHLALSKVEKQIEIVHRFLNDILSDGIHFDINYNVKSKDTLL